MRKSIGLCLLFAALQSDAAEVSLHQVYASEKGHRPVDLVVPPDDSGRMFLVHQRGQIDMLLHDGAKVKSQRFADFSGRAMEAHEFEEGLLGLAFHPKFKQNQKFYVYYSQQNPKRSVISEFTVDGYHGDFDETSERILMEVRQPFWNHNSGNMAFGPDGFLYICFGDGGKGNDPHRLSQNLFMLNGKIVRIDVDSRDGALAYGIPADNPFAKEKGVRPEIYAYGMRNPWGIYFEPDTGAFWCADVGQEAAEEINLIVSGGNYGWNYREGMAPFAKRSDAPPEETKFVDPIFTYGRTDGLSITGGVVYRGEKVPALKGAYIYGDWRFGRIWALRYDQAAKKVLSNTLIYEPEDLNGAFRPSAICEDENQELMILSWDGKLYEVAEKPE